jgi:hypothetical protein
MNRPKHTLCVFLGVVVLFLSGCGTGGADPDESSIPEVVVPDTVDPAGAAQKTTVQGNWVQEDYETALATMGATTLVGTYTGAGTAVVLFEQSTPFLNAELVDADGNPTGEMVLGNCDNSVTPPGHADYGGWAPGGPDCKVAWVMCFAQPSWNDDPTGVLDDRHQYCGGSPYTDWDNLFQVTSGHHATTVANGIATVAPAAKIITIQIQGGFSVPYKLAVEWLTHPSSDFDWYLANGYTVDEAIYYNQVFGGLSPAKYWNVVATTGSLNGLYAGDGLLGVFSEPCSFGANPEPELGLAYHEYLLDWHTQYRASAQSEFLRSWKYFDSHSQLLKDAGILPFFAAHNELYRDAAGQKFIIPNGVTFPACLESI